MLWTVLACSAGTFLIRFLPMLWRQKGAGGRTPARHAMLSALDAIGPAAVVALLVATVWSLIVPGSIAHDSVAVAAGLIGVVLGKRFLRSIAWATLAGVAAYGLALWAWPV